MNTIKMIVIIWHRDYTHPMMNRLPRLIDNSFFPLYWSSKDLKQIMIVII